MANYAVLQGNFVTNIITADNKEIAESVTGSTCIEYTKENPAGIGWSWDGTSFIEPNSVIEGEVVPPAIEG